MEKQKSTVVTVKKLTFFSIFLLGINGIIGSGTFLMPQQIYQDAGLLWGIITIIFAGIVTIIMALCFGDLSSKFEGGGGAWLYSYTAFGKFVGFEVGFFSWFAGVVAISTEIAALIRVFKNVFPWLESDVSSIIFGICIIAFLCLINWFGLNIVKWVNNISSSLKILTVIFFLVIGVFFMKSMNFHPAVPANFAEKGGILGHVSSAYAVVFYMFTGFSFLPIAARKMKNPQKNLPLALVSIMIACTAIYALVQFVVVGDLGPDIVKTSIPVATAMKNMVGEWGYYIIIVGSALSTFGVAFTSSFDVPIIASSLSNEHNLLPSFFGKENRFKAPWVSILLTGIVSSLLLLTGSYVFLATCVVCSNVVMYIPSFLAVMKLRKRPSDGLSFKGIWVWIFPILALIGSLYLFVSFNLKVIIVAIAVFVIALIIFFIDKAYRDKHGIPTDSPTANIALQTAGQNTSVSSTTGSGTNSSSSTQSKK